MTPFDKFDWVKSSREEQLRMARTCTQDDLRRLARRYDWSSHPEAVLGWIMAQKSIDLGSALVVFFNGDPERFNYLAKRDVPQEHRGAARVLDNICLRVNSGFYRVRPSQKLPVRLRLEKWLQYQQADRDEGRRGRWILDEGIIGGALTGKGRSIAGEPAQIEGLRPLQAPGRVKGMLGGLMARHLHGILPRRG